MKSNKLSKLPTQAVPVQRAICGSQMANQNGVDASFWGSLLGSIIPPIIGAFRG